MKRLRVVLDTNVVVSALLWQGVPGRVLERAEDGAVLLYTSVELLAELEETLANRRLARFVALTGFSVADMIEAYSRVARSVRSRPLPARASRDRDDDAVLACAVAARADFIASGDRDLLDLGSYAEIAILSPSAFLMRTVGDG